MAEIIAEEGQLPTTRVQEEEAKVGAPKNKPAVLAGNKAMYILQMTRDKISEESMKILKCLLLQIIRTTKLQYIVVEVYLDESEFFPLEDNLEIILKMLVTGYNLTEPEHSSTFPLV
jgi:hypothetical protein